MNEIEQPIPAHRRVAVWPHTLSDFEHFEEAVAIMTPNGALQVWRWGSDAKLGDVPIKTYAPGYWATYEHLGDGYPSPVQRTMQAAREREHAHRKAGRLSSGVALEGLEHLHAELEAEKADRDEPPAPRSRADDPDPFVQLAPEALDAEAERSSHRRSRRPRVGELAKPEESGEDGDDAAFRRSGDALPLGDSESGDPDEPESTGEGVAQRIQAEVGRAYRAARRWLGWLSQQLSTLDPLSPTHPHLPRLQPRWYTSSPMLAALVLSLTPVMLFLSFSAN